jgi:hypothetical protein
MTRPKVSPMRAISMFRKVSDVKKVEIRKKI